jgi:enamine deaminase RidA (YjgF/YER057c/UK114 family)
MSTHDPYAALAALSLELPPAPAPGGNYTSARSIGSLVYLSGVISQTPHGILTGIAGLDPSDPNARTIDEGYAAARSCALLQLGVLHQHLGSLHKVRSIVSVRGYVHATPDFPDAPKIINGASDLLLAVFGESGRHVRTAIGVAALPRHALVELDLIAETL